MARADPPAPHIVRILEGRLAGREHPLGMADRLCIGHGLANDIVLRGTGTRDGVIELTRQGDAGAIRLRVISGQAELLGRTMGPEDSAQLPPYLPFRFGEFLIAHGERGADRWDEALAIAASPCGAPAVPLPAPSMSAQIAGRARGTLEAAIDRIGIMRLGVVTASMVLLLAASGPLGSAIEQQWSGPGALQGRLADAGLGDLSVSRNPAGGLIVSGMVSDEGDLIRLRTLAAEQGVPVMVDVTSAASIASAATDILQAQGLPARAEPLGLGSIAVIAPYLSDDREQQLVRLLRRDLPGLRRVAFRLDRAAGGDALQSFFARSGTGLASVVADPGHIVTADGARWFPGAILPTGHRLVSVEVGRVRFEKNGRTEEIRL
ncbi:MULTISPECIES: hypothetical protein [unclassified Sphingomonas]|jgi:type III secretion system YscD/HrpQ family protein|uniref:hypothetical protein n=1 Tax=unclassified Sphingomonas TaxID=196159 RepID=UPI00082B4FA7|nr:MULTISPECIES: hypothetical protein [unclassified Sphingomonas]MCH4891554.1 hypothetical protein [Sphingomonas sp. SFZ2018-12]